MALGKRYYKESGGSGGRKGHSNMAHREHTETVKLVAKKLRRANNKKVIAEELS